MTAELGFIAAALVLLLSLLISGWRSAGAPQENFFPSQRQRVAQAVRLRLCALAGVALVALGAQYFIGQQRLEQLERKEERLVQFQAELMRLRVDFQLARARLQAAQSALTQAAAPPPAEMAEMAEVAVPRAVVRDAPAGSPRFLLTSGTRVELRGSSQDDAGREWREALTDDGRKGWMAAEVLNSVSG
jgi:Tfp pilus assembly protein PilN